MHMLLERGELTLLDGWLVGNTELEVRPGPAPRHWAPASVFERMTIDIAQNTHIVRLRAALFIISQDRKKQQNSSHPKEYK